MNMGHYTSGRKGYNSLKYKSKTTAATGTITGTEIEKKDEDKLNAIEMICSLCWINIENVGYKCTRCENYYLCEICMEIVEKDHQDISKIMINRESEDDSNNIETNKDHQDRNNFLHDPNHLFLRVTPRMIPTVEENKITKLNVVNDDL